MTVWLNGALVAADAARIDPTDRGLLLGDGLFETVRAHGSAAPLLGRHLVRLRRSAGTLDLPVPWTDAALTEATRTLLAANGLAGGGALRLTLTRGPGPRGLLPPVRTTPTLLIAAFPPGPAPPPARVALAGCTRRNERSPLSRLKALGYLDNLLALREARAAGADEAILLNTAGRLACAAAANLFLIEDGTLATPPPAEGALPGITRALVLELAGGLGLPCREEPLPAERLVRAEGAFLTGSLAGVRPVVAVGGRALGDGAPHPVALRLLALWRERLATGDGWR